MAIYASSIKKILEITKRKKITVVEDAAEAFMSTFKNKFLGTYGKVGCFSFAPNKIITTNENDIFNDKEINLVSIASYDENHYLQVCKSLSADKHVIVEKPICLKMSEMRDIENLLRKKKNLKIISNLVLRQNSKFNNIKKYINLKNLKFFENLYKNDRSNQFVCYLLVCIYSFHQRRK